MIQEQIACHLTQNQSENCIYYQISFILTTEFHFILFTGKTISDMCQIKIICFYQNYYHKFLGHFFLPTILNCDSSNFQSSIATERNDHKVYSNRRNFWKKTDFYVPYISKTIKVRNMKLTPKVLHISHL